MAGWNPIRQSRLLCTTSEPAGTFDADLRATEIKVKERPTFARCVTSAGITEQYVTVFATVARRAGGIRRDYSVRRLI